jgi:hypothetical protein
MINFYEIIYKNFITILIFSLIGLLIGFYINYNLNNNNDFILETSLNFSIQDSSSNKAYSFYENLLTKLPIKMYDLDSINSTGINIQRTNMNIFDFVNFKDSEFLYNFVSAASFIENREKSINNALLKLNKIKNNNLNLNKSNLIRIIKHSDVNYSFKVTLDTKVNSSITELVLFELINTAVTDVNQKFINHLNVYLDFYINEQNTKKMEQERLIRFLDNSSFEKRNDFITFFKSLIEDDINFDRLVNLRKIFNRIDLNTLKPVFINYSSLKTTFTKKIQYKPYVLILSYLFIGFFLSFFFIFIRNFYINKKNF